MGNSNEKYVTKFLCRKYDEIPSYLLPLRLIPDSKAGLIKYPGIVEVLADIYGACTESGGATAIDVNKFINQLQDLASNRVERSPTL